MDHDVMALLMLQLSEEDFRSHFQVAIGWRTLTFRDGKTCNKSYMQLHSQSCKREYEATFAVNVWKSLSAFFQKGQYDAITANKSINLE